jgi:hypothetical protein
MVTGKSVVSEVIVARLRLSPPFARNPLPGLPPPLATSSYLSCLAGNHPAPDHRRGGLASRGSPATSNFTFG